MRQAFVLIGIAVLYFYLGWTFKPDTSYPVFVDREVIVETEVPVTMFIDREVVVTVEKEPTPHPTDCVVMKWLDQ